MGTIISVEQISKQYRLGQVGTGTISHDLNRWWHRVRGKEDPYLRIGETNNRTQKGSSEYVWALRDVNFDVQQGEVLGIIGRNGAGKSTLLKILSRTTAPTTGRIRVKGRIASLLEVGTGFHPELTGRENIFLNGAILGMTKQEIIRKFDEIVDFAGVERYIDTPVKRYSSGMYVRLAFGVAAHLESEILIVDEVLAVGDAEFQNKCLGKMSQVSKGEGRTVLFVSHNMGAVKNLCNQALLMEQGTLKYSGPTADIIERYLEGDSEVERFHQWEHDHRPGNHIVRLEQIRVTDEKGSIENLLSSHSSVTVEISYEVLQEVKNLRVVANVMSFDGTEIFSTSDFNYQQASRIRKPGRFKSSFVIPAKLLNVSKYFISVDIDIPMTSAIVIGKTVSFTISELMSNELGITMARKPSGVIHPVYGWTIEENKQ
jgi:lipopolysaccharide transport system ATP-binding protein